MAANLAVMKVERMAAERVEKTAVAMAADLVALTVASSVDSLEKSRRTASAPRH
jgi:hypothetical protein